MKWQIIVTFVSLWIMLSTRGHEQFSQITNQTNFPIDVYYFKDLHAICFAGVSPVIGPDIPLSENTKPCVTECCFNGHAPCMSPLLTHETRHVPACERYVLVYAVKTTVQVSHYKWWFPACTGNGRFSYQMVETKPGWHYIIRNPDEQQHH